MNNEILSLQETSFKVIVNEFSRFMAAYTVTKDETLKRNFHFLKRAYSRSIFNELDSKGLLEAQHFDFLLNEYLKAVDVGLLLNYLDEAKVIDKVKSIGSSFSELFCIVEQDLSSCQNTLKSLLPHVPNVTKLCIPDICNDEILQLIASSCPQLTELDISESGFMTLEGLLSLCTETDNRVQARCPLKKLNVSDILGIDAGIAFILKHIPTLEEVICYNLPEILLTIHKPDDDNNMIDGTVRYNLTNIDFSHCEAELLTSSLKLCTKVCPRLKKVSLNISNTEELGLCSLFPELESIYLDCFKQTQPLIDLNSFLLLRGEKLKYLDVKSCTLSVSTLIHSCPYLETLHLGSVDFQHINKKPTMSFNYLRNLQLMHLNFSHSYCVESVESIFNACPKLESLGVQFCEFNDSKIIAKLSTYSLNCYLTHLNFNNTDIEVDLLQQIIMNCNSLQTLSLEYCQNIGEDEFRMLEETAAASNKKIEILWNDDRSDFSYYTDYDFDDVYNDGVYDDYDGYDFDYDYDANYDDDDDDDDYFHSDDW